MLQMRALESCSGSMESHVKTGVGRERNVPLRKSHFQFSLHTNTRLAREQATHQHHCPAATCASPQQRITVWIFSIDQAVLSPIHTHRWPPCLRSRTTGSTCARSTSPTSVASADRIRRPASCSWRTSTTRRPPRTCPSHSAHRAGGFADANIDASFYLGKKVVYIYRAKNEVRGTKIRCIWGKVRSIHGAHLRETCVSRSCY